MLLRKDGNMIDYILMSKDLNNLSETKVMIILFSGLILCIFFGSLFTADFYNNEKKWHNKLSWIISFFIVLFVAIFDISLISECLNKEKKIEKIQKKIESAIENQDYFSAAELKNEEEELKKELQKIRSNKNIPINLRSTIEASDIGNVLADKT